MVPLARAFILFGVILILVGGIIYGLSKIGIPLGHLPGDILIRNPNVTCLIPLATSLFLSILLTILLNLILRFLSK